MDCTLYLHAMLAMVAVVDLIRSFWGRTKRGTKVSAEGTAMSLQNDTAARVPRRDSVWRTVSSAATPQLLRRVGRFSNIRWHTQKQMDTGQWDHPGKHEEDRPPS